jgi:hypothetical protein
MSPYNNTLSVAASELDIALSLIRNQTNFKLCCADPALRIHHAPETEAAEKWINFRSKYKLPLINNMRLHTRGQKFRSAITQISLTLSSLTDDLLFALDLIRHQDELEVSIPVLARDIGVSSRSETMKRWCNSSLKYAAWFACIPKCTILFEDATADTEMQGIDADANADTITDAALEERISLVYENFAEELDGCIKLATDLKRKRPRGVEAGPAELLMDHMKKALESLECRIEDLHAH